MSTWNAMSYEAKDTILRVVRTEAEQFFAMVDRDAGVPGVRAQQRGNHPGRTNGRRPLPQPLLPDLRRSVPAGGEEPLIGVVPTGRL